MNRSIQFLLNKVSPVPVSLREDSKIDSAGSDTLINLGNLFLHYYYDSYPAGPPNPDPSRFEYVDLVSSAGDFRLHAFVAVASLVKRRTIATELGQAFCRLMLQDHFDVVYFAHMSDVLNKPQHAALKGMTVQRSLPGDVPDYLCARRIGEPVLAEAKGRFGGISFASASFQKWRDQFQRVAAVDGAGSAAQLKGYVVATRLATEESTKRTCVYVEDPNTPGERHLSADESATLRRMAAALHYSRVFRKLDLLHIANALEHGFSLTRELSYTVPVWTCMMPPFRGVEYVGGFYRTLPGVLPQLTERGWQVGLELGQGHGVFVGLLRPAAVTLAHAARGDWSTLDDVPSVNPEGLISSECAWLPDGTVAAPMTYFLPSSQQIL